MDFDHFLIDKGMHVCPGWPQQWQEAAQSAVPGFAQKSVSSKQELLYQEVLHSNLHFIGKQALPEDLQAWHQRQLKGLFVLQADETINIAAAAKYRYEEAAEKRCLKLMLTDGFTNVFVCGPGVTQVSGLEYRHIRGLAVHLPAGAKIAVKDVMIRRGNLLLTPENTVVLGGQVDELEAARQKALKRWNQPATGRTSRHEAGTVDLYAEASAAAWQGDVSPAQAQAPRLPPGPAFRSAPSQPGAAQPRSGSLPTTGSTPTTTGSISMEQTLPYRPVLPAVRPAVVRLPQMRPPAPHTPPDHMQPQLQPNQHVTHADFAHARPDMSGAATQPQAPVNGVHGANITPTGSETGAQHSNQLSRQSILPSTMLDRTGAAQRSLAAPEPYSQMPRSRLALSRPTPSQQDAGRPEAPPEAGHNSSSAAVHVTPNQPQQDLIVIDDSPQLPSPHAQPHRLADALSDDLADADGVYAATQPGKRQRRQLLDSSSDSDSEAAPAKAARTASGSGTRQASDQPQQGQAVEGGDSIVAHPAMGWLHGVVAHDIIPDSSADVGGMPEPYEDYGNEPVFDEDFEEPDGASPSGAGVSRDAATDWAGDEPLHASPHLESTAAPRLAVDSPMESFDCNQSMEIADSPGHALASDEAAGNMPDRSGDVIRATEALFNPPFTTLSNIAQYAPQMPASDFPMTLRINGSLGNPLCNLLFKDGQGRPLEEYSIDMELHDATLECTATVGHEILLQAVGIPPAVFCAKFIAGRKPAVQPFLQQMGAFMSRYSGSAMLMDVRISAPAAQLVIVHIHQQWTKADREAMQLH